MFPESTQYFSKINMIKLFKGVVGCGLVESKYAVELYLNTYGFEELTEDNVYQFGRFMNLFATKKLVFRGDIIFIPEHVANTIDIERMLKQ